MRVTRHCGKNGSPNHNDRNFDVKKAIHIDSKKTKENIYHSYDETKSFKDGEIAFYKENYSEELKISNDKKRAQRHPEKVRTIMDVYRSNRTKPDEFILQIGDKDTDIDRKKLIDCVGAFLDKMQKWNKENGGHFHLLNLAGHFDETTGHFHVRGVWDYVDENGVKHINRNKALQLAGVDLPNPNEKEGRYNNRKMSFDAMMRELWLDVCEKRGLKIEREPVPHRKHKDLKEYRKSEIVKDFNSMNKIIKSTANFIEKSSDNIKVMSNKNAPNSQLIKAHYNFIDNAQNLKDDITDLSAKINESADALDNAIKDWNLMSQARREDEKHKELAKLI